jgi:stringent starvation protein B
MPEVDPTQLHALIARLVESRVAASLGDVERAVARWRAGEIGALDAHGALLKHAARCERIVERVTAAAQSKPTGVLRDALDAGVIDRPTFVALAHAEPEEVEPARSLVDDAAAPDKRTVVEQLLEQGAVLVHVDARKDGVAVPARFRGDPKLVLRFGYGLNPAIVDLAVDDAGIRGTLTFSGQPFHCELPWAAVYAAVVEGAQKGMVWPEDIPDIVLAPPPRGNQAGPDGFATDDDAPPTLPGAEPRAESTHTGERPRPSRGHLKLVD